MTEVERLSCLARLCWLDNKSGTFEQAKAYFDRHEEVQALDKKQYEEFIREVGIVFRG